MNREAKAGDTVSIGDNDDVALVLARAANHWLVLRASEEVRHFETDEAGFIKSCEMLWGPN